MVGGPPGKVQSLYNTPCYIMDLDITVMVWLPNLLTIMEFYKGLQENSYFPIIPL